jgi:peptidoglycan/LPS O-acetylase OafA/YrhL
VGTAVEGRATAGSTEDDGVAPGVPARTEAPEPHLGRIPALDGIRALGIVLVLFFHGGFGWAAGGFFGVDVFFVLSGFLITGLLVSEYRQNAGIGLARFWGHRVRRLVPALLVMLGGIALYGIFVAQSDTLGQLRRDALATLLYVNNWHQVTGGQGYFAALNTPRPLLHTWSLSIEEQFYLIWPLVVLGVLRWSRSLRTLLLVTVAGAAASAVAMAVAFANGSGEGRAYYGTDTRAQALLIGAALAIVLAHPLPRRRAGLVATTSLVRSIALSRSARLTLVVLGIAGLVGVVWMSVVDNASSAWIYRGGFTLVALATAGIIACVALVPDSPLATLLSLRPVRYVGAISYGLYLFHWPIFVMVDHARTGLDGWPLFLLRIGLSFAVAAVSFHFLEMPVRRGALRGRRAWAAALGHRRGQCHTGRHRQFGRPPGTGRRGPGDLGHRVERAGRRRRADPHAPGRRLRGQLPRVRARPRFRHLQRRLPGRRGVRLRTPDLHHPLPRHAGRRQPGRAGRPGAGAVQHAAGPVEGRRRGLPS